jgi:Uma2 family endonuclease
MIEVRERAAPAGAPEDARRKWSREEYLRLAKTGVLRPDERVELIGGEILLMSPQRNRHVAAVNRATKICERCFPQGFWVRVQASLAIPGEDSMPEPDVAVVPGEIDEHTEDYPTGAVLVIEASDTTLALDRGRKASLYASAGIPDYWLQNLVEGWLEVRRNPIPSPAAPFGWEYGSVTVYRRGESVAPLAAPECCVPVEELLRWGFGREGESGAA